VGTMLTDLHLRNCKTNFTDYSKVFRIEEYVFKIILIFGINVCWISLFFL
jgi:hypothetical protein